MKYREVITYKNYFEDFFKVQPRKVQDKIIKVLDILETVERVPVSYLKYIEGTNGLFEVRVQFGSDIFRIFCCLMVIDLLYYSVAFRRRLKRHLPKKLTGQ